MKDDNERFCATKVHELNSATSGIWTQDLVIYSQ